MVAATSSSLDSIATGIYLDINTAASGSFTAINLHGRAATFIGYVPSTSTAAPKAYFFDNVPVDTTLHFEQDNATGVAQILGEFTASGTDGYFLDGSTKLSFTGPLSATQSSSAVAVGAYSGSVTGHYGSVLSGIVTPDGRITLYLKDGTLADAGATSVASTGAFTLITRAGNTLTGKADPGTNLLTGTLTKADGSSGGSFTGAQASGTVFSDGSLRNISSRGFVGSAGDQVMIAGFVVNSATGASKHVLVRVLGPALAPLGVSGVLADPTVQVFHYNYTTSKWDSVATNDNWGTVGAVISADESAVGASPALVAGSADAALDLSLAPGIYTAIVSGKGSATGVVLTEVYDVDAVPAYGTEKMLNISTRSQVSTGEGILIGGFVVNGVSPKKVMIRGVGPALAAQGVSGVLADPVLQVQRYDTTARAWTVVRENDDWEVGNDGTLVSDAAVKVGAFGLATGSKDAVILMTLPPGIYTAQLSGKNGTTGVGLIEVYEVQ